MAEKLICKCGSTVVYPNGMCRDCFVECYGPEAAGNKGKEKLTRLDQLATWIYSRRTSMFFCWMGGERRWRVGVRRRGERGFTYTYGPIGDHSPETLTHLMDQAIGEYNAAHGGPRD